MFILLNAKRYTLLHETSRFLFAADKKSITIFSNPYKICTFAYTFNSKTYYKRMTFLTL